MKKLLTRTLTGIVFVAVILAAVIYNIPPLKLLFTIFAILCTYELIRIVHVRFKDYRKYIILLVLVPLYCFLPFYLLHESAYVISAHATYHYEIILGFLVILWANDTGAYLIGSAIGKHKLLERISPKKTWEGLIGGILVALLSAFVISKFYFILNTSQWMSSAIIISIFGVFGDLFESLLKRKAGVKDSGNLLPGHGGFLDRFDALLFAAIANYGYLYVII